MTYPFTTDGYVQLIRSILERGYQVRDFHTVQPDAAHLVLRHDVDQSIAVAKELADVESAQGWASTWFVLARTDMYNPFSSQNTHLLKHMVEAGHEIGLHLDGTNYQTSDALEAGALLEARMLEDQLDQPVRMISFHRPSKGQLASKEMVAGRPHTYLPRYTQDMGYCSDSRGQWRFGLPTEHEALDHKRALQLLTHAIWWVGPEGRTPIERLHDFVDTHRASTENELAQNNTVWRFAEQTTISD